MPHLDPPLETETDDDGLDVPDELEVDSEPDVDELSNEEVEDEFRELFAV